MAYQAPVWDLSKCLVNMDAFRRLEFTAPDIYKRGDHILRCAGTPGLGKSTAAQALWPALYQAWQSPQSLQEISDAFGNGSRGDITKLKQRLLNSLAPERLLVFKLWFDADGLHQLAYAERRLGMQQILAARMLYAVMDPHQRESYQDFLLQLQSIHTDLLQILEPSHVEGFVRHCTGFSGSDPLIMVWVFDEAQCFDVGYNQRQALPMLLSAFVQFRLCCKADTLAMCLVATTVWSCLQLEQTASARAQVVDLQLLPLNSEQCIYIVHTWYERMRKQQQQQEQRPPRQQQHLMSAPGQSQQLQSQLLPSTSSSLQQESTITCTATTTDAAAAALPTQWPTSWLDSSDLLQKQMHQEGVQLPGSLRSFVQLCGGNPRMLCRVLASLARTAGQLYLFDTGKLLVWLDRAGPHEQYDVGILRALVSSSSSWSALRQWDIYGELLAAGFAHDVVQRPVRRHQLVWPEVSKDFTWETGEQQGLWSLVTSDVRKKFLGNPGVEFADAPDGFYDGQQLYVQVVPMLAAALREPLSASMAYLQRLQGSIQWRQQEFQDVGVIAVRSVIARQRFGVEMMPLQQLILCRLSEVTPNTNPMLLLPEHDLPIKHIDTELDQEAFDKLVRKHMEDPGKQPWAFIGPGNFKADGWLVMRTEGPLQDMEVGSGRTAAAEPEAFVIFVSSKQRTMLQKATATAILEEKAQDVISCAFRHAYVYVTDQQLQPCDDDDKLAANNVLVVSSRDHDAFYGGVARLLESIKL